jgi:hypothetical protein
VTAAIRERYRASGKAAKSAILDEFVAVTGVHRKHAIRLLSLKGAVRRPRGRPKARYGRAVAEALVLLWEVSDRVCSKRLKPMIPTLLPALERHGEIAGDDTVRGALLAVSPATIDRLLSEIRIAAAQGRRRRAGFSSAVRRSVPVPPSRTGAIRRRASSRWTSWRTPEPAPPAPSCRQWSSPTSRPAGPSACRWSCAQARSRSKRYRSRWSSSRSR